MKAIADLLFEAKMLKEIPRAGFAFLGTGSESIAAHSFAVAFIGYVLSRLDNQVDAQRLIAMCLVHDLPEARTGDPNYVNKQYVQVNEEKAVADLVRDIPFGTDLSSLIDEFNQQKSREARLAHDADQLAFILDLKAAGDIGARTPGKWLPTVIDRLATDIGKNLAEAIIATEWDAWWRDGYSE